MTNKQQQLTTLLLNLLPADHTTVGNSTLLEQFLAAAQAEGHQPPATEDDFKTAREALVAAGLGLRLLCGQTTLAGVRWQLHIPFHRGPLGFQPVQLADQRGHGP